MSIASNSISQSEVCTLCRGMVRLKKFIAKRRLALAINVTHRVTPETVRVSAGNSKEGFASQVLEPPFTQIRNILRFFGSYNEGACE